MQISVHMDNGWTGEYPARPQYEVAVAGGPSTVHVRFTYQVVSTSPHGGRLELPAAVADRLGRALMAASSGPTKTAVTFDVDEDKL